MLVSKAKLDFLLTRAKEDKTEIREIYTEVLEKVDPYAVIEDKGDKTKIEKRNIDSTVQDSIDTLVSFIMSSVFPRGNAWADMELDVEKFGDSGEQLEEDETVLQLKEALKSDVRKCFKFIEKSNYYIELTRAVSSMVKVGTGAYTIKETPSDANPFIYRYVGLDNLYILEDALSRPNIVFKLHINCNADYLLDTFGADIKLPEDVETGDEGLETNVNVYEIVVPVYNETDNTTVYNYMVTTEDFEQLVYEIELNYNPFVITTWNKIEGNSWGQSIVQQNLDTINNIYKYKGIFNEQAEKIANPPVLFNGNQRLYDQLNTKAGFMNYGGDPLLEGVQASNVTPILPTGSLMPLDKVYESYKTEFRQSLMVDSLSQNGMDGGKGITATYVSYMAEIFRKRFANVYENMSEELIKPTFINAFTILANRGLIKVTDQLLPYTTLSYQNALSKSTNVADVRAVQSYIDAMLHALTAQQGGVSLNYAELSAYYADKFEVPSNLIPDKAELEQIQQEREQQAMLAQQAQMEEGATNGE